MPTPAARVAMSTTNIAPARTAAEIVARLRSRISGSGCADAGRLIGPCFEDPGSGSNMLAQIPATFCIPSTPFLPSTARDLTPGAEKIPLRVLVVDDEALLRWAIGETLRMHGYEVGEPGVA